MKRGTQFERVDTASLVSNQDDRVCLIERDMETSGLLHGQMFTQMRVFVLVEIPHEQHTGRSDGSEHSGGVWSPFNVTDGVTEVKGHYGSGHIHIPHFDSPISRARQENSWVILVPPDGIDGEVVTIIGL